MTVCNNQSSQIFINGLTYLYNMYSTLKVGEKVFIIRNSKDEPIKTFVKEVIMTPTPDRTEMIHSGMYDIHGFGEMFGQQLKKIKDEEELLTA